MSDQPINDFNLREPGPLHCPKCKSVMEPHTVAGIEVDRCTGCRGLWFDMLEQEDLRHQPEAIALDSGYAATADLYDHVGLIRCPIDGQPMVRMVDKAQPALWLESCPVCYGTFFDAGEFREFTEEHLRDMFHRRRRPRRI